MRSDRGDAGSDVQNIFYEKVTALTGDQPPVVMVTPCATHLSMHVQTCNSLDFQLESADFCFFSPSARLTKTSILSTSGREDFTGLLRLLLPTPPPSLSLSFSTGMLLFEITITTLS